MSLLRSYEEQEVREGYICPQCMEDFPGINELRAHFESGIHEDEAASARKPENVPKKDQSIGVTQSHSEHFKDLRKKRLQFYDNETNKLLDRLEKLTLTASTEEGRRREYERQVVLWVSDEDVKLCPSCAKSFHFTRRKHHCRLCGAIMCQNCSNFIDYEKAKKLIDPTAVNHDDPDEESSSSSPSTSSLSFSSFGNGLLRRRGSTSSLFTVVSSHHSSKESTMVRMCFDCKVLLDRRQDQIEEKRNNPVIVQLYNRLVDVMSECKDQLNEYNKMLSKFNSGEMGYELTEAQVSRIQIVKYSEQIDLFSRRICSLGVDDATPPPVSQLQLQAKIRMAATNFLKQYTLGLQSLPTQEEIDKQRKLRRVRSAQRDSEHSFASVNQTRPNGKK